MQQHYQWTKPRARAAQRVAEDVWTDEEIASSLGVNRVTLHRWKSHAEFKQRVDEIVEQTKAALKAEGIVRRQNRVDELNDLYGRLRSVIDARATFGKAWNEQVAAEDHDHKGVGP